MGSWQVEIPRRAKRHLRSPPDHAEDKEEGRGCKDREQLPYYRNRASAVGMPSHDLGQLIKAQFPTLALAKPIPEEGEKGDSGGGGGETGCRTSNSTESSQEGWVVLGFTLVEKGPWPPRRSSQNGLILVKNEPRWSPRLKSWRCVVLFMLFCCFLLKTRQTFANTSLCATPDHQHETECYMAWRSCERGMTF